VADPLVGAGSTIDEGIVTDESIGAGAQVRRSGGRMEFLDALRGVAAMFVVVQHCGEMLSSRYADWTTRWLMPGELGVVLFFLCSGFIIPASIERYGSVARFWIGRFFRLYPMYWAAMAAAFVLDWQFGRYSVGRPTDGRLHLVLTNASMVERMLRSPMWTGAAWSLAYEVVFYLLVTTLFIAGVYRSSIRLAVLALAATVGVAAFRASAYTSIGNQGRHGVAWMLGVFLLSLAVLVVAGRMDLGRTVAVAALLALIVPLVANRNDALWFAFLLFACMFVGTVLFRAVHGDLPWGHAGLVALALGVVTVFTWRHAIVPYANRAGGPVITWYGESLTFLVAFAIFGVGLLLRNHRFPWVARELGRISYSLYLVHALVIHSWHPFAGHDALTATTWIVVSIAVSMATYRLVEQPCIDLGRKVSARWAAAATG
jgi:peptidoglycan/LPS O-acetylase OafA/YrhL